MVLGNDWVEEVRENVVALGVGGVEADVALWVVHGGSDAVEEGGFVGLGSQAGPFPEICWQVLFGQTLVWSVSHYEACCWSLRLV